jgi:hypothetical protein
LQLSKKWLDQVKAIPKPFLKGPISGIIVAPDNKDAILIQHGSKLSTVSA